MLSGAIDIVLTGPGKIPTYHSFYVSPRQGRLGFVQGFFPCFLHGSKLLYDEVVYRKGKKKETQTHRRYRHVLKYEEVYKMSSQDSKNFQDKLRLAREAKGFSQGDLADKTGLQPSAISHFESGRRAPSFENLRRLADALSVSTDFLLGRVTELGNSGPIVQKMFRHAENLSAGDLETLASFAKMLSDKNKPKSKPTGE